MTQRRHNPGNEHSLGERVVTLITLPLILLILIGLIYFGSLIISA